MDIIPRMP